MPLDNHSSEQDSMLKSYHFGTKKHAEPPGSISPFVPCASRRIPAVLRAARLQSTDCFWDLGCGDGRICIAAAKLGASAAGIEIEPSLVVEFEEAVQAEKLQDRVRCICGGMSEAL